MENHKDSVTLKIYPLKIFFISLAIVLILVLVNVTTQIIRFTVSDSDFIFPIGGMLCIGGNRI